MRRSRTTESKKPLLKLNFKVSGRRPPTDQPQTPASVGRLDHRASSNRILNSLLPFFTRKDLNLLRSTASKYISRSKDGSKEPRKEPASPRGRVEAFVDAACRPKAGKVRRKYTNPR